ncbi:hypothetical protein Ancab_012916 [Ancistrocladus abbreviatus]
MCRIVKSPSFTICPGIGRLEHPHFIEVPLSSPEGLYLRDVVERLNVLRGHFSPVTAFRLQTIKQLPEPPSSRSLDETSSSSSLIGKDIKHHQEDEISPSQHSSFSGVSPESRVQNHSSWGGSLSLTECKVFSREGAADASTQTEDRLRRVKPRETCTRGVSTDDRSLDSECIEDLRDCDQSSMHNSKLHKDSVSPSVSSSSESSSGWKTETLESLIRADARKMNSSRILEEEGVRMPSNTKLKASNMLLQLLSCGSISVKDHSFGLIPTYRPMFSHSKFPSPLFSTSVMLGELDCLPENRRLMSLRLEDKEYFSGSLIETKILKDRDGRTSLKRSSSFNADRYRTTEQLDSVDGEEMTLAQSKCIPQAIKASLIKQPRSESMRSPIPDKPRISVEGADEAKIVVRDVSNGGSKRMTEPSSQKKESKRVDSAEEKEKIIKIEES